MNLSGALSALANYFADALEGCERPVCHVFRYVGNAEMVGDGACDCTCAAETSDGPVPQGALRLTWRQIGPMERPPGFVTVVAPGAGAPWVEVHVRVMRCWPGDKGTSIEEWDTAAAGIADDAWCLACTAHRLVACTGPQLAELDLDGCASMAGYLVEPVLPSGACAGNDLRLFVRLSATC